MKQIKSITANFKEGTIKWMMTKWCNYRCEYCILSKKPNKFPSLETLIEQGKKLNNYIEKMECENVRLCLIGGEVTYFDLETIFKKALTSKKIKKVYITTNLSNKLEYYTNLKKFLEQRGVFLHYSISFHATEVKDYSEFMKKVNCLANDSVISVVVNNENQIVIKKILQILGLLENKKVTINFDRLLDSDKIDDELYNLAAKRKRKIKIEYEDGEIINSYKEDLQKELGAKPDFYSYKCEVFPSYKEGKIEFGSCSFRQQLENKNKNKKTVVCKSHKCSFCDVIKVYK